MIIYIAGSISGQKAQDVVNYFQSTKRILTEAGFTVLNPMTAKKTFRNDIKFKAEGYSYPAATNHAIIERDRWMVQQCDILYCNLTMAQIVSIGSTMELAWAHQLGKHSVVAMQADNIHRHAFILEAADIVWETHEQALDYLFTFGKSGRPAEN
jgi:nucleoside 2-deoxyribosyltransferase